MCWFTIAEEYQRIVRFRAGKVRKTAYMGPGLIWMFPCCDDHVLVDMRTVTFEVPPQEVLTKDSVTVSVDAVIFYRVVDPIKAVIKVANYSASTQLMAATTLRNVLGTRDLSQLLSDREEISQSMKTTLFEATEPWGIEVERVEIKDVRLPEDLQKAMAQEAEADRQARAKIIVAEGEIKASRALKEASVVMTDNSMALQLRYLQSLTLIAAEKESTIIYPFPMDFITAFTHGPLYQNVSTATDQNRRKAK